jgi:hypothetical protein
MKRLLARTSILLAMIHRVDEVPCEWRGGALARLFQVNGAIISKRVLEGRQMNCGPNCIKEW